MTPFQNFRRGTQNACLRPRDFPTGWIEREKDFIGAQVPLNEIKVAIARWKEEEQTSTTTFVDGKKLVVFIVILVWWSGF